MKIEVSAHSSAPVERVWALLADARGWPEWTPFDAAELEREGSPVADGVGAIRRFTNGKTVTRECVVAFEPPHWLAYQLLSGLPVRDYRADVTLQPAPDGGTAIRWQSRFEPLVPGMGWLVRRRLEPFIGDVAQRLARRAEMTPKGPPQP
jgi:uncharacterized protein YndB with AHSA1/START domain